VAALTALVKFHGLGWAHGDARDANVACVSRGQAFMIDLARSQETDDTSMYMDDVGTLLCSWLHLDVDRDETWEVPIRARSAELVSLIRQLYSTDGANDQQTCVEKIVELFDKLVQN